MGDLKTFVKSAKSLAAEKNTILIKKVLGLSRLVHLASVMLEVEVERIEDINKEALALLERVENHKKFMIIKTQNITKKSA